jgi:hypothetical protein
MGATLAASGRWSSMLSLQQLLILAIAAMAVLALSRVARVQYGRTPHLEGRGRRILTIGLLYVPPLLLALTQPSPSGQLRVAWIPTFTGILLSIWILMGVAALVARFVAPHRYRPLLMLALAGIAPDPYEVPFDPPMTAKLAQDVALVDSANSAFPRGREFPTQIDRTGFRRDWDALEDATRTLEGAIADDFRLGLAVASGARATATDARSRLDTLRRLTIDQGRAWAS